MQGPPRGCAHEGRVVRVRDRPRRGRVAVRAWPRGRVLRDRRAADPAPDPGERDPSGDSAHRRLRAGRDHQGVRQPERPTEARADCVPARERTRADHGPPPEDWKRHVRFPDAEPPRCPERVPRSDREGPGCGARPVRCAARRLLDRGDDPAERGPDDDHDARDALTKTDGFYDYGYRLSIDARDSVSYLRVHVHVETTAPLGDVLLPGHSDLSVVRNGLHMADAFLNQTRPTPTSDLLIRFRAAGSSLSQFAAVNGDRYVRFSVDATDSAFASSVRPTPRALLILLDGSGSMGFLDRWALAKDAVRRIASDLGPGESYGVAVFHGATVTTFSPTLQRWTPATEGDLVRFLDSFRPHGSTGLATPL